MKKNKVEVLKKIDKRGLNSQNIKLALAGVGVLLLIVGQVIGLFLLLGTAISHFKKKA